MTKIATLAAVLLIGSVVGPVALSQNTTAPNSGAGVPGLPGNKSGPAVNPGKQFNVRPDQSNVPGLPGNKSGPALQPPTGLQNRAQGNEEFMEYGEIELRLRPVKASAQGFATFAHAPHRIDLIRNKVADLMLDHDPYRPPDVSPPDDGGAEILRMQRPDMQADTQERKAGGIEPPGEFVDRGRTGRNPACRADHPIGNARCCHGPAVQMVAARPSRR
jgi:hypothetical protein